MIFTRLYLAAIVLPLALMVLLIHWRRKKSHVAHPLLFYLRRRMAPASPLVHLPKLLELLALGLLLIALTDPVSPATEYLVVDEGLDILLVLDLSSSMQEPLDLKRTLEQRRLGIPGGEKSRLDAVKEAVIRFVQKRRHDRIGIVVFSENGYVVAPMSVDTPYLKRYLEMVDHKTLASEGQTAIGEGILTALHLAARQGRGQRGDRRGKLIVVLTDGENNTGRDLYAAIRQAGAAGFKIHFIGVEVERLTDAPRLIAAVEATGGSYYDVRDPGQLERAYLDIDRLEKGTFLTQREITHLPRFYPFALASLALLATGLALRAIPYFIEIS